MRTFAPDELLQPGDLFSLTAPQDLGPSVFLARDFAQGCLRVAELGGENRNARLIAPRDLPLPGEFLKWPLKIAVDGLRDDYSRDVLAVLRGNLTDLRFAVAKGMNIFFDGVHATGQPPFSAYADLPDAFLFRRAVYGFGGQLIRPFLDSVDVNQLGVIPPEYIHRDQDGRVQSWDAKVNDLRVTEGHIPAIKQTTEQAGVQVYPECFQGANIFPISQRDRALTSMHGYLQEDDLQFDSLEEAHDAVLALVERALAGRT